MKKGFFALVVFFALSICVYAQNCVPCNPSPCDSSPCDTSCSVSSDCGSTCGECSQPCSPACFQPFGRSSGFYGRADVVFWNLGASGRPLVLRNANPDLPITANRNSTETAFAADDFSRQTNGSFRILIGKNLNACTAIEGQYNGFRDRQSSRTLTGAHDLSLPGALGMIDQGWGADFAHSSQMAVFSEMDFHSAELNLVRRSRCPSFVWLAGFRYFNFEEDFGLRSTPFIGAPHWYSDYAARTTNNLYGGQCGAKWDKLVTDRFGLQAVGKFGVYGNNAAQRSWIYEENPPAPGDVYRFADVKKTVTSLSGELNLGGYFKVAPNVSIVGGYNLMWIGDVARAADQLDFSYLASSGQHVVTDTLFMHGASVGVEWNF